jgi:hypothetical protein
VLRANQVDQKLKHMLHACKQHPQALDVGRQIATALEQFAE